MVWCEVYGEFLHLVSSLLAILKVLGKVRSLLGWAKRILGIASTPSPKASCVERHLDELDARRRAVLREIKDLKASSVDWYELSISENEQVQNEVFHAYDFGQTLTLAELKEERLKREAHELKVLEDDVMSLLTGVDVLIGQRRAGDAKHKLDAASEKIANTSNSILRGKIESFHIRLEKLRAELAQEEVARQAEEKRRKEEEEKRRRYERERRAEFKQVLEDNDVQFLYHFTAKKTFSRLSSMEAYIHGLICISIT